MKMAERGEVRVPHRFGGLLWQRNFRLLWVGETISGAGNAMAGVGMPLLAVTVLQASTFTVATLTAAAYLPWLVIGLPAGAWVDRLPGRPLMITCDVLSALLYASLPVTAWIGMLTVGQVVIVALLAGAVNVLFATAYQVTLPSLVAPEELVEGNAKLQGSASVATIGGGSAAGLAAQALGATAALLFNAASFLVSAACLLRIRTARTPHEPAERTTTVREEISAGIRFVARDRYLRTFCIYAALANLLYTGNGALVVVFLVRVVGLGAAPAGLLIGAGGVGGLLGALLARPLARRLGTGRALLLSTLVADAFGLLIPLTGAGLRTACYVTGAVVVAAGIVVGNIIVGSFRQAYCPPPILGRVIASMRFLVFGSIPLGALLAGGLGTVLGVRNALWVILSLYALSGTLLLTPCIRSDKDLPTTTAGPSIDVPVRTRP